MTSESAPQGDSHGDSLLVEMSAHDDVCWCSEPEMHIELVRLREALVRIEAMPHDGCFGCPACIAHKTLRGHWPARHCCWPRGSK